MVREVVAHYFCGGAAAPLNFRREERIMGIQYFEQEKIFKLDTKNTSYVIGIVDQEGFIGHVYYGKRLKDYRLSLIHI